MKGLEISPHDSAMGAYKLLFELATDIEIEIEEFNSFYLNHIEYLFTNVHLRSKVEKIISVDFEYAKSIHDLEEEEDGVDLFYSFVKSSTVLKEFVVNVNLKK